MRANHQSARGFFGYPLALGCLTLAMSGCSIGSPGYMDDYATVGGKWQRSDPTAGRVGSSFSDPNSTVGGISDAEFGGEIYQSDVYEWDETMQDGMGVEVYEGDMEIEEVPYYEEGSIILGDEF